MCGIAGKLNVDPAAPVDPTLLRRMAQAIRHCGPDDEGIYTDGPIGLAARRLAIIDLSPHGHQPMSNADGSLWIVFNGEVYNFLELRQELVARGHRFRSHTDTEVVVHLYQEFGVDCLWRLRGMFAFAIWDRRQRSLFLARDRVGKKPLFYRFDGKTLVFCSEPKAILADPTISAEPDLEAIHHYLTYQYVPSPWSAFKGLRNLPPLHPRQAGRRVPTAVPGEDRQPAVGINVWMPPAVLRAYGWFCRRARFENTEVFVFQRVG